MNRFDFTPYRRSTVGFDHLFDLLENSSRGSASGDNYPPFNLGRRSRRRGLTSKNGKIWGRNRDGFRPLDA